MSESHDGATSPAQAVAAVSAFFAREGVPQAPEHMAEQLGQASSTVHPDLGVLLTFRGPLGTIWVSPRGAVIYYAGNALRAKSRPVAPAEGFAFARSFAEREVPDFSSRNFAADAIQIDGTRGTARWTEKPRAGVETAIFPNWVEVVVDLTAGRVARFSASDLRLVRTTPTRITQADARARIKSRFQKAAVEEIELMQLPVDGGRTAITVWTAMVMTLAPEGPTTVRVSINADTGEFVP